MKGKIFIISFFCLAILLTAVVFNADARQPMPPPPPFVRSDLVVTTADIMIRPASPLVGRRCSITVRAFNRSRMPARNFYLNVRIAHGTTYFHKNFFIRNLAPGRYATHTFSFIPRVRGEHILLLAVDPTNSVYETSERNNFARHRFFVR